MLSRSEFKLLEALEVFDLNDWIDKHRDRTALDLGAAPGGWTRVLRGRGWKVIAVDPAPLAPSLSSDPGVTAVRASAQEYLERAAGDLAMLVCDMRMDARDAARLLARYESTLRADARLLMTLKLPSTNFEAVLERALAILAHPYEIVGARQLFHNRHEVTVCMRPRRGAGDEGFNARA